MTRPNTEAAVTDAVGRLRNWVSQAHPGDEYTYHVGLLSADRWEARYENQDLTYVPVEPFHSVGLAALAEAQAGHVTLWQRRRGPAEYEYIMRKT